MGAVGQIADLLDTIASWFLKPDGYQTWTRERKLKELHDAVAIALAANQWTVLDLLLAEYRRLSDETGP